MPPKRRVAEAAPAALAAVAAAPAPAVVVEEGPTLLVPALAASSADVARRRRAAPIVAKKQSALAVVAAKKKSRRAVRLVVAAEKKKAKAVKAAAASGSEDEESDEEEEAYESGSDASSEDIEMPQSARTVADDADADEGDADDFFFLPKAAAKSSADAAAAAAAAAEDPNSMVMGRGRAAPESDSDSSYDDEPTLNRTGDVPAEWYADTEHVGYDIDGNRIMKPKQSAIDGLIAQTDDPKKLRTIIDPTTGESKVLTNEDLALLFNLQRNRAANPNFKSMYDDYEFQMNGVEFDPLNHPLARSSGPSKKRFVPALHETKKLAKLVAKRMKEMEKEKEEKEKAVTTEDKDEEKEADAPYLLWDSSEVVLDAKQRFKLRHRIPKPAAPPPGTYESYRPPAEYLPSDKAKERFARLRKVDRKEHFLPKQFGALRHVPFYNHTIQDRFQRCLDLSVFPRRQRTRLVVDPDKLLPELPNPKDLRPYPERLAFVYKGHTGTVRSISVSHNGQYLATACDDHIVRIYEVMTGRLMKRYDVGGVVQQVEFCPNRALNILAVAVDYQVLFFVPTFVASTAINEHTIRTLRAPDVAAVVDGPDDQAGGIAATGGRGITQSTMDRDETAIERGRDLDDDAEKQVRADFTEGSPTERAAGVIVKVTLHSRVRRFTFHAKGDYVCVLCPKDPVKYRQTIMLQLSQRKVFCPFRKFSEVVTDCRFHPTQPYFYLATTNTVRCYNLLAHKMTKRYKCPGGLTTCIGVHPNGDHFLVGDTTSHTSWFDTDFSDKAYKRMKSHRNVVNGVEFHPNTDAYPLFASASSDGQVHVFHGMVYDDYNKNALIVPVKILKHQRPVYALAWHPSLPWVFTATDDGAVCCWTE